MNSNLKQRKAELIISNRELAFQNEEKEKRAAELIIANKELAFQNEEKEKRAAELILANKELVFQNEEKEKRAAELIIANKELAFQNEEKEKRAAELILANKELVFQNEEKEKRAAELIIANEELAFQNKEKKKRAEELIIANAELKAAEDEIRELNQNLEDRVLERTAELSEANKTLEAFSYFVSHDLKAPVRSISSFTSILNKKYGVKMGQEAKELFDYIADSAKRMTIIIEDLLKLAKFGKDNLKIEAVNMTKLVSGIWLNLCRHSNNNATIKLTPLPVVYADMSMMEQVLINLLSNSIKYSSKREVPVIEIWSETKDMNVTFYFKDNGVGFDMENYERLFGAFERLHDTRDFEGTGVGLTLVKSIIEKHGGKIGAQAKVDEGALFYFTLPQVAMCS